MDERYKPKTLEQKLGWLTEECGEVCAALGKTQRWGLASVNPELPPSAQEMNGDWILRELWDLERAIVVARAALLSEMLSIDGEQRGDPSMVETLKREAEVYAEGFERGRAWQAWQPIETAPQDGRRMLLWTAERSVVIGRWNATLGVWQTTGRYGIPRDDGPTHWMDLPTTPADERGGS